MAAGELAVSVDSEDPLTCTTGVAPESTCLIIGWGDGALSRSWKTTVLVMVRKGERSRGVRERPLLELGSGERPLLPWEGEGRSHVEASQTEEVSGWEVSRLHLARLGA